MLDTTSAENVTPRRLRWLWRDRVPLGAVTILAGDGGLGKSTLTTELAARLSQGQLVGDLSGTPVASYILSVEDDAETTVVPRLIAAGADLTRIHIPADDRGEAFPTLPDDLAALTETVRALQVKLLVLDPLGAFLSERVDSWKDQRVRRAMAPVARLARQGDIALVGIMHLNRRDTTATSERISGSPAFRNAARSVLIFGPDPDDPDGPNGNRRILAQEKANLTRPGLRSIACRIESVNVRCGGATIDTSRVVFVGDSTATATTILSPAKSSTVERWLRAILSDGPRRASDIEAIAAKHEFTASNLRTARLKIGIKPERRGGISADGWWEWNLPPTDAPKEVPSVPLTSNS